MSAFSWDQRVARAERLAKQYSASAEMLTLYVRLARFQQSVYARLKTQSAGTPIEQLEPDFKRLLSLVQSVGPAPLAEKAGELLHASCCFADVLLRDPSEDLQFFKRVLFQPYREYKVSRISAIDRTQTTRHCPACGELPQVAMLRSEGEGGKRWLLCSLCSTEWEFRRLLCPNCGEEDQDLLPVYTATDLACARRSLGPISAIYQIR